MICKPEHYVDFLGIGALQSISLIAIGMFILAAFISKLLLNIEHPIGRYVRYVVIWFFLFAPSMMRCDTNWIPSEWFLIPDIALIFSVIVCCFGSVKFLMIGSGKEHSILLIGSAGAGKTYLTYGLLKYLSGKHTEFAHGEDSMSRAMMQEVEEAHASGNVAPGTIIGITSNKVSFAIKENGKQISIFDFSGEAIKNYTPVNRVGNLSPLHTDVELDLDGELGLQLSIPFDHSPPIEDSGAKMLLHRANIKHIVFLIHPLENGTYPHKDVLTSLQSNLKLVEELTMRTSNAMRSKKYSKEVKAYYPNMRKIRIHCVFTMFSNRQDNLTELATNAMDELFNIDADLWRLVGNSKGTCQFSNVIKIDQDGKVSPDNYLIDELAKSLVS